MINQAKHVAFVGLMASSLMNLSCSCFAMDLTDPRMKDVAMQLVASAENSNLNWQKNYGYIEDIHDDRGYTAGLVGFTTGTGDILRLVEDYTKVYPHNALARFIPALKHVDGTPSHEGLGSAFEKAWQEESKKPAFQLAQRQLVDSMYLLPAVEAAKKDGLHTLGQFIYFDALVMHGSGDDSCTFEGIRARAIQKTKPPALGGDEVKYLHTFLDERRLEMQREAAHKNTSRVDTQQRKFLEEGNLEMRPPLRWQTYQDSYEILELPKQ